MARAMMRSTTFGAHEIRATWASGEVASNRTPFAGQWGLDHDRVLGRLQEKIKRLKLQMAEPEAEILRLKRSGDPSR